MMPELWEHQNQAVLKAYFSQYYGLFFEQGTGKTRTIIEVLKRRFNNKGRIMRTLIFTPSTMLVKNWRDEWLKFTGIDPKLVIPLYDSGKKRLQVFTDKSKDGDKVFITNYESLLMGPLFKEFIDWCPEAIVLDESHRCKSISAKRAKLAYGLANPYKMEKPLTYILTGTPMLKAPMDLFQQYKIMDGGLTFGHNFYAFRARYFRDRNASIPKDRYFPKWELCTLPKDGFDAMAEIQKKLSATSMRVTKEECLDLPEELSVVLKVGMSPVQERLYKEMKKDFLTFYNSRACVASLAITKALRLLQITSGFVSGVGEITNQPIEETLPGTPKEEALRDLLGEIAEQGHKALVWAVYKNNYSLIKRVCDELKLKYVEVHGEISDSKKRDAVDVFQNDPEYRVFIGHPGSGGIGINLTCASYSIFYSRTFSLEHYLQARARNHRAGQKHKVTHYDLVCEGTIEEIVLERLKNKEDLSDQLLSRVVLELGEQS